MNVRASEKFLLCLFAVSLTLLQALYSQQVTASVQGQVMDPSGSPIPNATITAKDVDRGTTLSTITNAEGIYTLPRLNIGRHEIRAEAKGFQTSVHPPIALEMNQIARVDFQMTV